MNIFKRFFKSYSEKEIDKTKPIVDKILSMDEEMSKLSDNELRAKTDEFKNRLSNGETLDDILPEAFAVVREASGRVLGMKHYPVQLVGGIILHNGQIAEMKTGEGKTLVATLPSYLNALEGKGVHVVTVNDYLAKRDMEWMGKIHEFLGLSVGCIVQELNDKERKENYSKDITYGTNNQFGFDYLRDNMAIYKERVVQRGLHYAIVDEVDSILIDDARTPLIISGKGEKSTDMYEIADRFVNTLTGRIMDPEEDNISKLEKMDLSNREFVSENVDYVVNEKRRSVTLTEKGSIRAEKYFGLNNFSDVENMELAHHINQALKANNIMKKDVDYVIQDGNVKIVDESTGRIMEGRRYSDGLHQAIEAKEGVEIKNESKTLATITFQNFFRMYDKLSGMTGTAMTEKDEFADIYGMDVVEIPTNKPVIREDLDDIVLGTEEVKFETIVNEIERVHNTGQPILVGTISIEKSELLSKLLKRKKIDHEVLNAKFHKREAEIVAQAGRFGQVTIATNMAGRGTDIVLGGNPETMAKKDMVASGYDEEMIEAADSYFETDDEEILEARSTFKRLVSEHKIEPDKEREKVVAVGGLYVLGTERHESRRIDNQLRGRSGRQGDPGTSRFYISLQDDLIRLFGGSTLQSLAESEMYNTEPIESKLLSSAIERAQKVVESNHFATRKRVLEYDNVMNRQREVIYGERNRVLNGDNMKDNLISMLRALIDDAVDTFCNAHVSRDDWEIEGLREYLASIYYPREVFDSMEIPNTTDQLKEMIYEISMARYNIKEEELGSDVMREVERVMILRAVDSKWMDHIDQMDQLRQGIGLRAFANEDPVRAYSNEGFDMFNEMNHAIREDTIRMIFFVEKASKVERKRVAEPIKPQVEENKPIVKKKKIGRNDPCPCGSGKKYKNCHGRRI